MKNNKKTLRLDQSDDKTQFGDEINALMRPRNRVFLQARWAMQ
jgi:hypothetical protein